MTLQTLKGFRDFLPGQMAIRNKVIDTLKAVFTSYGFEELQTPTLEYAEVLTGKYGEEADRLMYLFNDPGNRQVGLRFDLTVPLARVMSQYQNLSLPFKRFQIQPAFRAENTQKGRYREFYQCDIDTVGSASPLADAEILAVISDSLKALDFKSFTIRVNSRQILFSLIEKSGIPEDKALTVIQSIDKLDKKSQAEVETELSNKSLSLSQISNLFTSLKSAQPDPNLVEIIDLSQKLGAENVQFSPFLSRGLDYYTGTIFESIVDSPKIGSITGGGRYDNLIKQLGGPDLPAVGTTIGLERIVDVITELKLWPDLAPTSIKTLVTIFSPELMNNSLSLSQSLRSSGIPVELYPDTDTKLDKQLKYADKKGIPFAVIIGPDEIKRETYTLKNLSTQSQESLTRNQLLEKLTAG